ncbi:MAG TPA: acylphosphatase [Chitinispirillaceae bacterium]|nr:acylphosphatase [Chitinispirillaceae bacterium]
MEIRRISVIVKGLVQGVNFRFFTSEAALKTGVSGWVRNLSDGNVEIEAQGTEERLERFIREVRKGPRLSLVESTSITDIPVIDNENGFVVRS